MTKKYFVTMGYMRYLWSKYYVYMFVRKSEFNLGHVQQSGPI